MGNDLDRRFGRALKALRESRGKSQEDFVKIGRSYLSELERGLKTPTLETIVILAEELGVTPTYLVALATQPPPAGGDAPARGTADLPEMMTRAFHLAVNPEREVAGLSVFTANNSLQEVSEIASASKVELGRLLADAALLAFRETQDRPPATRRDSLEFIVADKRPPAVLEYAVDGDDHWWLRPQVALDAIKSANWTIELLDDLSRMNEIPIFRLLGMRNLSSFIGAIYIHSLWQLMKNEFILNPHQDGYPDLCARTSEGRAYVERVEGLQRDTAKESFTHYKFGGIEVKATCGNTPPPTEGQPKPQIGDPRIHLVQSADWKAHHRSTNNLLGLYWDFIDGMPTIVGLFYSNSLSEDDWGKIVMPKIPAPPASADESEKPKRVGRTTSVSVMKTKGVKKMGKGWVTLSSDPILIKGMGKRKVFDLGPNDVTPYTSNVPPGMLTALTELAAEQQQGRRRKQPSAPRQTRARKKKPDAPQGESLK